VRQQTRALVSYAPKHGIFTCPANSDARLFLPGNLSEKNRDRLRALMLTEFLRDLGGPLPVEPLFDELPGIVFFVKDRFGRYVAVNQTLVERCGARSKSEFVGRLPGELFPADLGAHYQRQDEAVLRSGRPVVHQLELHFYKHRRPGWCLTTKRALRRSDGTIWGLIGISRDVHERPERSPEYGELSAALAYIHENFPSVLRVGELAARAGLSVHQFEQRTRRLLHLSPMQLIQKLRIDEATRLLETTDLPLAQIAIDVGYCDQSAFTRQFRAAVGLAPGQFRQRARERVGQA
jgi:PAS domain S-box-containing protein